MRHLTPIAPICCGIALLWGSFALAQSEVPGQIPAETDNVALDAEAADDFENRYRIGIDCGPISEALQRHLRLPEASGLLVNFVVDDSPAGRAGVQRLDVIVNANDRAVGTVMELVRQVNEAGPEQMTLTIIRDGEQQEVTMQPEERDEREIEQLRNGFRARLGRQPFGNLELDGLPPEFRNQLRQFEQMFPQGFGAQGQGFRRVLPGIMLDQLPPSGLPNGTNLNIQVEKSGDGPARIKIQRGNETWEVTENDLDALPADIRPMVENMLNGSGRHVQGQLTPDMLRRLQPRLPRSSQGQQLDKRFDGLELQLQQLQDAIRRIEEDQN